MSGDARTVAWMAAWNRIETATNCRIEYRKQAPDPMAPLPPDYDALIDEAGLFARLATAEPTIGFEAQEYLERIQQAREQEADAIRKMSENVFGRSDEEASDGPT